MNLISKTDRGIVLENSYFSYSIGFNGKVLSFADKADGKNYIANQENPYFCYLNTDGKGTVANPINMELADGELVFGFISGAYIKFKPEIKDNYISFELTKAVDIGCYNLVFANTLVDYPIIEGKDFFVNKVEIQPK